MDGALNLARLCHALARSICSVNPRTQKRERPVDKEEAGARRVRAGFRPREFLGAVLGPEREPEPHGAPTTPRC